MTTALRPMSTGEILDRTFSLYRNNFRLFVGISCLPPALTLVVQLLLTGTTFANRATSGASAPALATVLLGSIGVIIGVLAYLVGLAIANGATAFAVSAVHLGHETSISESYGRMKGRYGRLLNVIFSIGIRMFGATLLIFLAALAIPLAARSGAINSVVVGTLAFIVIIGAVVLAVMLFLRYSLAVPACVVEDIKARASLKRSVFLSKGSRGKIFAIYLLVLILNYAVAFAVLLPIGLLATVFKTGAANVAVVILNHFATFLVGAVVGPIAVIALALVYYDERVRKEAFDIQLMMESLSPVNPPEAAIGTETA